MTPLEQIVLLGVAEGALARQFIAEVMRSGKAYQLPVAASLAQIRARLDQISPVVILLDESALNGAPLEAAVRELTESSPVIVVANPAQQSQVARLVAEGDVEFVARVGEFACLAASLIERRMRWAERSQLALALPWSELPADFAEVLRHEINNPLTGILGNAELLLAHREKLPASATQRLETIVDLAVRLRETIRRISQTWSDEHPQLRSA
jgi:signal transduction histidine kinase